MKKILLTILLASTLWSNAFAADQWDETSPAGTTQLADIDANLSVNFEAADRLLINYKRGFGLNYSSASAVAVLAGEIAIPNAAGTTIRWRRLSASTTAGWGDIDTGAEASSTTYYIYATADTDITGVVLKISTSSSAPSGATYYRLLGQFYNNSSSNITEVLSYRSEHGTDYRDVAKAWVTFNGSTMAISKSYNVASITDNGTGDYTITWSTAFGDANYASAGVCRLDTAGSSFPSNCSVGLARVSSNPTTSATRISIMASDALSDAEQVSLIAFGDRT